jgi:Uma2 family endonuclease
MKPCLSASIRYPAAMVVCSAVANSPRCVTDPVVVFEVLSESTSYPDRIVKAQE